MNLLEKWTALWKPRRDDLVALATSHRLVRAGSRYKLVTATGAPARPEINMAWVDGHILSQLLTAPKRLVTLKAADCEALAHVEIKVPLEYYRQPFPMMIVSLPDEFGLRNQYDCGYVPSWERFPASRIARPRLVLLDHITVETGHAVILASIVCDNGHAITSRYLQHTLPTLEDNLNAADDADVNDGLPPISAEEHRINRLAHRIAFNAMLLMTNYGFDRVPDDREKVKRKLKYSKKPLEKLRLRAHLNDMPFCYEIRQSIKLYHGSNESNGDGEGSAKRPHWRRGHWRMQAVGPQWKSRRLTFIPPVLIHGEKFLGPKNKVSAEYKL